MWSLFLSEAEACYDLLPRYSRLFQDILVLALALKKKQAKVKVFGSFDFSFWIILGDLASSFSLVCLLHLSAHEKAQVARACRAFDLWNSTSFSDFILSHAPLASPTTSYIYMTYTTNE